MTTTLVVVGTLALALLLAARFRRQPAPPPPGPKERDFFDEPFALAGVARRARQEAAVAGRAAAEGRPIARRLEDLPSRKWIVERIEERVGELRQDLAATLREIEEDLEVAEREEQHVATTRSELQPRVDELRRLHAADQKRPREEQDLGLEKRLAKAEAEFRSARDQLREHELRRERLEEQRVRIPEEVEAEITHLHEAGDTLLMEHDMAYEAAEHGHPGWHKADDAPGTGIPHVAPVVGVAEISERARTEAAVAGRAAANGNPIDELESLPSRRWVIDRFGEHIGAVRAQLAKEKLELGEELDVIAEHIREADRSAERAKDKLAELAKSRTSGKGKADGRAFALERETQNAQRALEAAQGRRHDHDVHRERLLGRQPRIVERAEAVIAQLDDARKAALAEHDMAYEAARHAPPATVNGHSPRGPEAPVSHLTNGTRLNLDSPTNHGTIQ